MSPSIFDYVAVYCCSYYMTRIYGRCEHFQEENSVGAVDRISKRAIVIKMNESKFAFVRLVPDAHTQRLGLSLSKS